MVIADRWYLGGESAGTHSTQSYLQQVKITRFNAVGCCYFANWNIFVTYKVFTCLWLLWCYHNMRKAAGRQSPVREKLMSSLLALMLSTSHCGSLPPFLKAIRTTIAPKISSWSSQDSIKPSVRIPWTIFAASNMAVCHSLVSATITSAIRIWTHMLKTLSTIWKTSRRPLP